MCSTSVVGESFTTPTGPSFAKDDPMTMVMTLHGTLLALHGRLVEVRDLVASVNPLV